MSIATTARNLLFAGHSHIVCFGLDPSKDGGTRRIQLRDDPQIWGVQMPWELWERPDDFIQSVSSMAVGQRLALMYSGWNRLLFAPEDVFDFVASEFPSLPLDPGARVLPESFVLMHDEIRNYPFMMRDALQRFRRNGIDELVLLCQPPPKGNNDAIRALLKTEHMLVDRAKAMGLDVHSSPITPAFIRLKLWSLIHRINRQEAAAAGATYVGVPPRCHDEHGFLKEEFWGSDVTHANRHYGDLYIEHILSSLEMARGS